MALADAEAVKHSLCTATEDGVSRKDLSDDEKEDAAKPTATAAAAQHSKRVLGRSATLGRSSITLEQRGNGRSSEFTRVKRMNTLHCLVRKPRVAAAPVSCSAPSCVPAGAFTEPAVDDQAETPTPVSVLDCEEPLQRPLEFEAQTSIEFEVQKPIEFEVQEATMDLVSTSSSTTSISSDTTTSPSSPAYCSICNEDFWPSDTVVLFGDQSLHLACFQCGSCKSPMGAVSQFLIQANGKPLCFKCCPVCHSCKEKILRNHISVLNKDFHEPCLVCSHCKRSFPNIFKVYVSNGEPCCASCVTPVFNEMWGSSSQSSTPTTAVTPTPPSPPSPPPSSAAIASNSLAPPPPSSSAHSLSPSTDSGVSDNTSTGSCTGTLIRRENGSTPPGITPPAIPPKLETLTRAISSYTSPSTFHSLIRPSFSDSLLSSGSFSGGSDSATSTMGRRAGGGTMRPQSQSLTSLQGILYDEYGALLFINFCLSESSIELVVFWLDVEHFKHFDGRNEDLRLFAHHIMLKYIGDFAELPLSLPQQIQQNIVTSMQQDSITEELFNESQSYVYKEMEQQLLGPFLRSDDGHHYLQALVHRDLCRMSKTPTPSAGDGTGFTAKIVNFDKRRMNNKYYVYMIEVTESDTTHHIFRRYSEWHSLNQELRRAFPEKSKKFPSLPKKIFFGRSQIRVVAEQRLRELQAYLQGLLSMPPEVVGSPILRRFLTQTELDKEDEAFDNRIQRLQTRSASLPYNGQIVH